MDRKEIRAEKSAPRISYDKGGRGMKKTIAFSLNGDNVSADVESHKMLLSVLRDTFQLTGTKEGCGHGECGACTVLVDGFAVNACLYPASKWLGNRSPPSRAWWLRETFSIRSKRLSSRKELSNAGFAPRE